MTGSRSGTSSKSEIGGGEISTRPALITGGAGFIGVNLADRLLSNGRRVIVLDNLSRPGVEHNMRYLCDTYGDLVQADIGDVRDRRAVEKAVALCGSIYHLVAQAAMQGVLPTRELLTHRYRLEELPPAMRDMEDRPEGFLKG